jgi:hypothetical protein
MSGSICRLLRYGLVTPAVAHGTPARAARSRSVARTRPIGGIVAIVSISLAVSV